MTSWIERDPAALQQLEATLRQDYPTMHAIVVDGAVRVRGTYPVVHEAREIARYSLCMKLPADYPYSLPVVWETADRIPRVEDRHVNVANGSLCLGVPAALWIALGGNFAIDRVLDIPVRNFLIGNCMIEAGEDWPHGEWAHGAKGMLQFFGETIGTDDPRTVVRLIDGLINEKVRGHWPCPCGSGAIVRKCHAEAIQKLRTVPTEVLAHSGVLILNLMKRTAARNV
ncbi:MAG: hypothetical protein BGN89_18360 [Alphaproteobacteria bacterium 64-6]|nr:MAG: hypothetical protein BGN89_18360 [Alphaproteobacteria bacterium 64-6]